MILSKTYEIKPTCSSVCNYSFELSSLNGYTTRMSSFKYFFNDRLPWDLKWTISQKLYRAKEDARGMGAINIIPFWPVKGMGTNSMKELEFYEITIFVKHSANIIVRHVVNSIIFILTDALWWYWLQHVEAQLTDHYLPKDRNACIGTVFVL